MANVAPAVRRMAPRMAPSTSAAMSPLDWPCEGEDVGGGTTTDGVMDGRAVEAGTEGETKGVVLEIGRHAKTA